ncbi:hypothetical protein [Streptomyces sp. TP-A0874]|uniref:hypothetical protein n=1 Tax=Streptomyces sp. TP-A0874 TaxID=549819 RepID=UPI00147D536A|nr:hypothetical protein [Streptomyces sp. TP-A0874]
MESSVHPARPQHGAWVALETVAELERLGAAPPEALIVSSGPHKRHEVRDVVHLPT